jgi:predicted ATP-grasp superfamily ATP-dependent carboligase
MQKFLGSKVRVLVLGLEENGLGVLRALRGRSDLDVRAVSFSPHDPGRLTWLAPILRWPDSAEDPDGFESRLYNWSRARGTTTLFPTRDVEVNLLASLSNTLPDNLIFHRNSISQVSALTDKRFVSKIASEVGLDLPKTVVLNEKIDLSSLGFCYPIIIKPYGQNSNQFPYKNLFISNVAELEEVLSKNIGWRGRVVLQEYIPGGDDQVYQCNLLLGHRPRVIAAIEFHKIRQYLPGRGIASYGETTLSTVLVPLCLRLADAVDYQGLMSVEFKKDLRNCRWIFIETNLRLPAYNAVFPSSGVNLAYLYVLNLLGKEDLLAVPKRIALWMNEDLDSANVLTHKVRLRLLSWIRQAIKVDSFAFWCWEDPLPGLYCIGRILYKAFKRLFLRQ